MKHGGNWARGCRSGSGCGNGSCGSGCSGSRRSWPQLGQNLRDVLPCLAVQLRRIRAFGDPLLRRRWPHVVRGKRVVQVATELPQHGIHVCSAIGSAILGVLEEQSGCCLVSRPLVPEEVEDIGQPIPRVHRRTGSYLHQPDGSSGTDRIRASTALHFGHSPDQGVGSSRDGGRGSGGWSPSQISSTGPAPAHPTIREGRQTLARKRHTSWGDFFPGDRVDQPPADVDDVLGATGSEVHRCGHWVLHDVQNGSRYGRQRPSVRSNPLSRRDWAQCGSRLGRGYFGVRGCGSERLVLRRYRHSRNRCSRGRDNAGLQERHVRAWDSRRDAGERSPRGQPARPEFGTGHRATELLLALAFGLGQTQLLQIEPLLLRLPKRGLGCPIPLSDVARPRDQTTQIHGCSLRRLPGRLRLVFAENICEQTTDLFLYLGAATGRSVVRSPE